MRTCAHYRRNQKVHIAGPSTDTTEDVAMGRAALTGLIEALQQVDETALVDPSVRAGIERATQELQRCKTTGAVAQWFFSKVCCMLPS